MSWQTARQNKGWDAKDVKHNRLFSQQIFGLVVVVEASVLQTWIMGREEQKIL